MNYYERIQRSIDYIESRLDEPIDLSLAAQAACMSLANYYRLFLALTDCSVKEYIRLRRISIACGQLAATDKPMTEIAFEAGFNTQESFIKVFKKILGTTPGGYRKNPCIFSFQRRNIMEEFFVIQDKQLLDQFPDIKVLKKLPASRVAFYCHKGLQPELPAWNTITEWVKKNKLDRGAHKLRYFGFDNPSPSAEGQEYGYEAWVTIGENVVVDDPLVKEKYFPGGLFAVQSTTVKEVFSAWMRMGQWLHVSGYTYREDVPCLEELILFGEEEETTKLDLYLPIMEG